jgi:hypothetical protein
MRQRDEGLAQAPPGDPHTCQTIKGTLPMSIIILPNGTALHMDQELHLLTQLQRDIARIDEGPHPNAKDLADAPIDDDGHRVAGIIDEQLVAADMGLAHRHRQSPLEAAVEIAEA